MLPLDKARKRAIELDEAGCYVAASILLEAVVSHRPDDGFAWLVLSDAYKPIGRLSLCRAALERALTHSPHDKQWIVYVRFAMLAEKCGQFIEAEQWYRKADLEPSAREELWIATLRAANLVALEEFSTAERVIRSAIESDGELSDPDEVYHGLGLSLIGQEKYAEARDALKHALALGGDSEATKSALMALEGIEEAQAMACSLGEPGGQPA